MTQTSPRLRLPMVVRRCSHDQCKTKDTYRLVGSCANCSTRVVGMFVLGHEANSGWNSPECPVCECRGKLYWKGLEDTAYDEADC